MALTDRKRKYAEARMSGMSRLDSALAAGCPEASASQTATKLERDEDVLDVFARNGFVPEPRSKGPRKNDDPIPVRKPATVASEEARARAAEYIAERDSKPPLAYSDPLDFFKDVVNDPVEDPKLRLDAAKAWDAGIRGRAAGKGKKDEKAERAEKAANKFAVAKAPLKAVK